MWSYKLFSGIGYEENLVEFLNSNNISDFKVISNYVIERKRYISIAYKNALHNILKN